MKFMQYAYYTGEQAMKAVKEEQERIIEIVMRELDSNGQAHAIALAVRETVKEQNV